MIKLAKGYLVEICVPIEVRCTDDLVKLVTLVKRLLKRETTLDMSFQIMFTRKSDGWMKRLKQKANSRQEERMIAN